LRIIATAVPIAESVYPGGAHLTGFCVQVVVDDGLVAMARIGATQTYRLLHLNSCQLFDDFGGLAVK
jgi:hypothetical protein